MHSECLLESDLNNQIAKYNNIKFLCLTNNDKRGAFGCCCCGQWVHIIHVDWNTF